MRKFIIRYFDKIVLSLLAMAGLTTACERNTLAEYGAPNADFIIKGTVSDSITTHQLKNIRVVRQFRNELPYGDTIYTSTDGKYQFTFNDIPLNPPHYKIKFEDIDGEQNGGEFITREVDVQIGSSDWVDSGDGDWYDGKAVKTQNIKLNPKAK